ncbi:hypothetical protein QJS10_CPB20g00726 [Acorus calamus]|uniref:Endonuclease/exonuclease/phosphatase domain-containing protein n=1 Tax=Acorus calamus TaxID=4465 RepID=A0AAV9C9G7_ACOCL|nr:hypothetical protein QJS10_CPB20g00726 [Acorus calamus]
MGEISEVLGTGMPAMIAGDFNTLLNGPLINAEELHFGSLLMCNYFDNGKTDQQASAGEDYAPQLDSAVAKFYDLQSQLETFWAQRARVHWGDLIDSPDLIREYAQEYFSTHWASKIDRVTRIPLDILPQRMLVDMASDLIRPFSRLKKVLPILVGEEQGTFVPHRSIHANLLMVQDIMHSLRIRKE